MGKDIILKSGWVKINKPELDELRKEIRRKYELEGGSKKFNSHLDNYEELRDIIKSKIRDLQENDGIQIKVHGEISYDILPGNTFFRNLLYSNKDSESLRFQEYNIEICYLFAYSKKRFDYLRENKIEIYEESPYKHSLDKHKFIVSSTMNNMLEADKIITYLKNLGFTVESETRNTQAYSRGSLSELYSNLNENTLILSVISRDYLQNETCVRELINFTNKHLDTYLRHTFHILLEDIYDGDFNIFDSLGRSEILKYWKLRSERLEENHKLILSDKKSSKNIFKKLSAELKEVKNIIIELNRVLDLIRDSEYKIFNKILLNKITNQDDFLKLLPEKTSVKPISSELEKTYKGIKIPSTNNPKKPEFPPMPFYKPKFPASRTFKIYVPGFTNVWLKDESTNPTGTHKDRLAWEVVIKYKSLIQGMKYKSSLPQMSIISSGSAAIAIQHLLNLFKIPAKLKVLVDKHLKQKIKDTIQKIGCQIYETDLSAKLLTSDDIKSITDNSNGIDITYRETLDPNQDNYYDWMSYEILKENPNYCFIPFGTGDLFINVLNIAKVEYFNSFVDKHDPRFFGDINTIKKCNFFGASANHPDTLLDKLYSSFLPSLQSFKDYIKTLKQEYNCVGKRTDFYYVEEKFVETALEIASKDNINCEPSGIAGLALLLQMKNQIPKDSKILIVNTGKTKSIEELGY